MGKHFEIDRKGKRLCDRVVKKKKTIDDFIEKYTRYILDIFYVFGLVEIIGIDNLKKNSKAPGDHLPNKSVISIKASKFFKNRIRLSDYFRD